MFYRFQWCNASTSCTAECLNLWRPQLPSSGEIHVKHSRCKPSPYVVHFIVNVRRKCISYPWLMFLGPICCCSHKHWPQAKDSWKAACSIKVSQTNIRTLSYYHSTTHLLFGRRLPKAVMEHATHLELLSGTLSPFVANNSSSSLSLQSKTIIETVLMASH